MQRWIVGIDEVGRGALAGPVVVAAAAIPVKLSFRRGTLGTLRDSKKLTVRAREAWAAYVHAHPTIRVAFARVYPRQIERRNISNAANAAAARAFARLAREAPWSGHAATVRIFLDGGLFLGHGEPPANAKTIIKGDEKINAVKIASIVAKVHRDRFMRRLAKKYPAYGFEVHKGYGTKAHRLAIRRAGPSEAHRATFLGKLTPAGRCAIMQK